MGQFSVCGGMEQLKRGAFVCVGEKDEAGQLFVCRRGLRGGAVECVWEKRASEKKGACVCGRED